MISAHSILRLRTEVRHLRVLTRGDEDPERVPSLDLSESLRLFPEERLILFRLSYLVQSGSEAGIDWSVRCLAKICDSNETTASRLKKKLIAHGLIVNDKSVTPVTRAKKPFIFSLNWKWLLKGADYGSLDVPLRSLQNRILLPDDGYNPERRNRGGFSRANRWLLAVLLEHANNHGVVEGLGTSDLRDLTGMSKERLRSQLDHLVTIGFLHAIVPGKTDTVLLGRRKSVYFINLRHSYFASDRPSGMTMLLDLGAIDDTNRYSLLEQFNQIRDEVFSKSSHSVAQIRSIKALGRRIAAWDLGDRKWHVHQDYIAYVVDRYASLLLSKKWVSMSEYMPSFTPRKMPKFLEDIAIDLHCYIEKGGVYNVEDDDELRKKCDVLLDFSIAMTAEVQSLLLSCCSSLDVGFEDKIFVIIPSAYRSGQPRSRLVIELFDKKHNSGNVKCILISNANDERFRKVEELDDGLTNGLRYHFGLINEKMLKLLEDEGCGGEERGSPSTAEQ